MVVPIAGGLAAPILAILLIVPLIRYRLTTRNLVITFLGIPVRWVSLKNIRYISDYVKEVSEPWPNTFNSNGRQLFILKQRGLFRCLMITPPKRFVFKAEIERAIRKLNPEANLEETSHYVRSEDHRSVHQAG